MTTLIQNRLSALGLNARLFWRGPTGTICADEADIRATLFNWDKPCFIVRHGEQVGATNEGEIGGNGSSELLGIASPISFLGDADFCRTYGVRYAYAAGAMANGIASEEMVVALGQQGILGSFGAAGLLPDRIEGAIRTIQTQLPNGPYAFNLIHSPHEEAIEQRTVELYLDHDIRVVEASAFLALTPHIVRYRAAGLSLTPDGQVRIQNHVIAKISRQEVAAHFMHPAPLRILQALVEQGLITEAQMRLAALVPMADDITVEADSGGHTDNRPLVALLPSILTLRDTIQDEYGYQTPIRIGAAGGISTPAAVLAAFAMGAAYVVTGSINQACVEADTSIHSKQLLTQASIADVMMAPAADMFEMGVKVQVLKKGTLFPVRAQKLYELYRTYDCIEAIPAAERAKLETQIFRQDLTEVWQSTISYFSTRNPALIVKAEADPKRKMALIFRWYLGLSSRWSNSGETGREVDYQIWCGPSMGAFNEWVRGTYLEDLTQRRVADVAEHMMIGAAYLSRIQSLASQGVRLPVELRSYRPQLYS